MRNYLMKLTHIFRILTIILTSVYTMNASYNSQQDLNYLAGYQIVIKTNKPTIYYLRTNGEMGECSIEKFKHKLRKYYDRLDDHEKPAFIDALIKDGYLQTSHINPIHANIPKLIMPYATINFTNNNTSARRGYGCRLDLNGQDQPKNPYGPIERPNLKIQSKYGQIEQPKQKTRPRGPESSACDKNKVDASLDAYLQDFAQNR